MLLLLWPGVRAAARQQVGDWALTRKEMAALLRQERRYRREKQKRERHEQEEEARLSRAIERSYRKVIGLPDDDETPIEVIAEAFETAPLIDIEQVLAELRQSADFEAFLEFMGSHRVSAARAASRIRRKRKALLLAA